MTLFQQNTEKERQRNAVSTSATADLLTYFLQRSGIKFTFLLKNNNHSSTGTDDTRCYLMNNFSASWGEGGGEATNKEGDDFTRNVGTGFSDLCHVKHDYIVVLSGVQEDKEKDAPLLGPSLSYRYKLSTWLQYGSALSVTYGIDYVAKADPCTLLDVP